MYSFASYSTYNKFIWRSLEQGVVAVAVAVAVAISPLVSRPAGCMRSLPSPACYYSLIRKL